MNLLKKIEELKNSVDKFENLVEDMSDNILSKQKKIDFLETEIKKNIEKIDEIIKNYNKHAGHF